MEYSEKEKELLKKIEIAEGARKKHFYDMETPIEDIAKSTIYIILLILARNSNIALIVIGIFFIFIIFMQSYVLRKQRREIFPLVIKLEEAVNKNGEGTNKIE